MYSLKYVMKVFYFFPLLDFRFHSVKPLNDETFCSTAEKWIRATVNYLDFNE